MAHLPGFGPAMIGQKAFSEQQQMARTGGAGFGSRMVGPAVPVATPEPPLAATAAPTAVADPVSPVGNLATGSYSVKDVDRLLTEAPGRTYDLAAAEFNRADGPRKSALKLIRDTELAKEAPRRALVDACAKFLAE